MVTLPFSAMTGTDLRPLLSASISSIRSFLTLT